MLPRSPGRCDEEGNGGGGAEPAHSGRRGQLSLNTIERSGANRPRMAIRIVRLGSPRAAGEGLRLGTVRRPPRGVPRSEFASRNYYDVWLPDLAPSEPLVRAAQRAKDAAAWRSFVRRYRAEMRRPGTARLLDLLAALSYHTDFSIGCYCEDEERCHRSVLRRLLEERGAEVVPAPNTPA